MKKLLAAIIIIALLGLVGYAYYHFFFNGPGATTTTNTGLNQQGTNGFSPFGRIPGSGSASSSTPDTTTGTPTQTIPSSTNTSQAPVKQLRMLSGTPVGGYSASTTANTTNVRWIDRGRGNVLEFSEATGQLVTLSNTILPRVYTSVWNKNVNAFIGSMLSDGSDQPITVYSELRTQSTSTASTSADTVTPAPYELKGKNLPSTVVTYAVSPAKDKVFLFSIENGRGVGYIANFDGTKMVQLFDTPVTQVNVDWPETNTIAITTKGSSSQGGFLYFVNTKTGVWKKILGPIAGLSARVSHDAKYVLASSASNDQNMDTAVYSVGSSTAADAVIRTIADKCAWGNFNTFMVYCAVPTQPPVGTYPDDWYRGTVSFTDKIWSVNAKTGEVKLVSTIVDSADRIIDAFNLGLDPEDNYLFFMNKNDLTLWSFDLIAAQSGH